MVALTTANLRRWAADDNERPGRRQGSRQRGGGDGRQRLQGHRGDRSELGVLGGGRAQRRRDGGGSIRDLRVAEVVRQDLTIENGGVTSFRVRLAISFKYESGD